MTFVFIQDIDLQEKEEYKNKKHIMQIRKSSKITGLTISSWKIEFKQTVKELFYDTGPKKLAESPRVFKLELWLEFRGKTFRKY